MKNKDTYLPAALALGVMAMLVFAYTNIDSTRTSPR